MKLIQLTILLTSLAVDAQKFRQEQFPFPPQFQSPNSGLFPSDSSLYLPPESHTPIPYFPMKNHNGLQYPLLPATGTKAPSVYPSPFPFIISTTLVPNYEGDDDDEDNGRIRLPTASSAQKRMNQTERISDQPQKENREMRAIPMRVYQPPIQNRNDAKFPFKPQNLSPTATSTTVSPNQTPVARRMIIETPKSDLGFDQFRPAASLQSPQFLPAGPGLYVSSTTEPAIPILRLSNEMDLDGSFSYEALGADQTHYVQHSRMENLGPDKQEQVVEGSYSYVGDNGQTYTVHYIADANGFRASGDHLPVAPPVPEIIQRAVQYNLAEEAKKPPHLRENGLWHDDRKDNEISDTNKTPQFTLPPTRNLFTGRNPEAFSYSFSQGSNTGNNLVAAASNQSPVKTVEYTQQTTELAKNKPNNGPISPQITFLASQGAHVPSINPVQDTISRMFTTEKLPMPQLMNYEADSRETEQEPNKGLWRWQYGINANNLNQTPNKETISRSFSEGDDIMINFSDMTPEEYTNVIRSQFEYTPEQQAVNQHSRNLQLNQQDNQHQFIAQNQQNNYQTYHKNFGSSQQNSNYDNIRNENIPSAPLTVSNFSQFQDQNKPTTNKGPYYKDTQIQFINNGRSQLNLNNNNVRSENYQPSPSTVSSFPQSEEQYKQINNYGQNYDDTQMQSTNKPIGYNLVDQNPQILSTHKPQEESRKLISDTPKILTHKDFRVYPSQTVTQSYNFDEDLVYEPRKIKTLNNEAMVKNAPSHNNDISRPHETKPNKIEFFQENDNRNDKIWAKSENEYKESTTQESYISSVSNIKFSDFILQDSKNDFKPIVTSTSSETPQPAETTTQNIVEDILQNNIFLKNLFNAGSEKSETLVSQKAQSKHEVYDFAHLKQFSDDQHYPELKQQSQEKQVNEDRYYPHLNQYPDIKPYSQVRRYPEIQNHEQMHESTPTNHATEAPKKGLQTKSEAEPKTDKITKLIPYQPVKQINEVKEHKKKPLDIAELLNYVSMKNHFESSKVKNNKHVNNFEHRNEMRLIPLRQQKEENQVVNEAKPTFRPHVEQQEELKGMIKNYKVLQRNNNNVKYDNSQLKRELSPPPVKSHLPPLGRAGPSMKSYLPPVFV